MIVLDASAVLAFLQDEPGADAVEQVLPEAACAAANWSETAQKVRAAGGDWGLVRALLLGYGMQVEPVVQADAERAAELWTARSGLSLGDRLCMAVSERLDAPAWTADRAWPEGPGIVQIR